MGLKVSWILFDLGNVLVDYRPGGIARAEEAMGLEAGELSYFLSEDEVYPRLEIGLLTPDEFVAQLNERFHRRVTPAEIVAWFGPDIEIVYPEIPPLLRLLRRGYSLGVLSNTFFGHWDYFLGMEIAGLFAAPMASHLLGSAKPDPRIYLEALRRIRAKPHEVLFVDDREENVAAALDTGLHAFRAKGGAEVAEGLRKLLDPAYMDAECGPSTGRA